MEVGYGSHIKELQLEIDDFFRRNAVPVYGIVQAEQFEDAPVGRHPMDILPSAKTVIVFGLKTITGAYLTSTSEPYTFVRNKLTDTLSQLSLSLATIIDDAGYPSIGIDSVGPCTQDKDGRQRAILSLKHAAVLAGLGSFGKNSLVLNKKYGNRLWFGAVISDAPLQETGHKHDDICLNGCTKCIDACCVNAIKDGSLYVEQEVCWQHAFDNKSDESLIIRCFDCRKACPLRFGEV